MKKDMATSHDFSDETIYWVTAEPFKRTTVAEGKTPQGYYYSAYNFSAAEHVIHSRLAASAGRSTGLPLALSG